MEQIISTPFQGAAAIAASVPVPSGERRKLVKITCHLGSAPTNAGSLTITLNSRHGPAFDVLLDSQSMVGVTNYVWMPDRDIPLLGGDSVDVAYANPDNRTYGLAMDVEVA